MKEIAGVVNGLSYVPPVNAELYQGQPIGITRVVKKAGDVVATFTSGLWSGSTGAPTVTQGFTGYDISGNVTGVTPRTQPEMLLVEPTVNTSSRIVLSTPSTNIITKNLNGRFGLWVYVDLPSASLTTNISINVNFSTNPAAVNEANAGIFGWTSTAIRQGWNFLVFIMRNPLAYVPSSGVSETQFNGFSFTAYGTGAFNNIKDDQLTLLSIDIINGLNHKIYFDSILTNFDAKPQIVFGCDAGPNLNEIAVPIFKNYGWKGYVAIPFRVHTTGSETVANMSSFFSDQVMIPSKEGWDVINHTLNHKDMTLMNAGKLKYEMLGVQAWYAQMGAVKGNEFYAAPGSKSNKFASKVLKDLGFRMQRNTVHQCNYITAWGIDETTEIGSVDFGSGINPAFARITSGTKSDVVGWQRFSRMKEFIDLAIDYGCAIFPFWHGITTVGDDGTGEGLTGDALLLYASSFTKICDYIREKELSGEIEVCNFTQLYYGVKQ